MESQEYHLLADVLRIIHSPVTPAAVRRELQKLLSEAKVHGIYNKPPSGLENWGLKQGVGVGECGGHPSGGRF